MLNRRSKLTIRGALQSPVVVVVLLLCCALFGQSVWERYTVAKEMAARRAEAAATLQELEARRAALEERVDYLSNERGLEAEMRRQFDVARAGEQVVIIVDDAAAPAAAVAASATSTAEAPWYQFWR